MSKKHQKRIVTAAEATNNFSEIIDAAYLHDEHLIVSRDGVAVVAVVPMTDYESLVGKRNIADDVDQDEVDRGDTVQASRRLTAFLDNVHDGLPDVSEDEANEDFKEAIRAVRAAP